MFTKPLRELTLTEALTPTPGRLANLRPAAMMGGQFLPGAIACRATVGATITRIVHPGQAPPEPRYRPSKKLADFVRCRDMTCRFPGCKVPATNCDRGPYDPVAVRADGGVQPEMSVPTTPLAEDVLGWRKWLARRATRRRHRHLDRTRRPATRHHTGQPTAVPRTQRTHQDRSRSRVPSTAHHRASPCPRRKTTRAATRADLDDAARVVHPRHVGAGEVLQP